MERKILTVSQVNKYVKQLLMYDYMLNNLWIQGEVSNLKQHGSGHIYFTLKDKEGSVSAVMFKSHASTLKFKLEEGMSIVINGYISLYEKTGQYQLYVQKAEPEGKGALYKAFEQLKEKLSKEGLFDESHKQPIPFYPKKIGVVTSGTGAAIKDIINVCKRRNPSVQLVLYPVLVQGIDAPISVANAINTFNKYKDIDVLIVGRGGGSIEDLWAFNEEIVARAIYHSNIPVISAVGHETDYTISDFVADLRAPTPSAAAELAVPSKQELNAKVKQLKTRLLNGILKKIDILNQRHSMIVSHPIFRMPNQKIDQHRIYIDQLDKQLNQFIKQYLYNISERYHKNIEKLSILSPDYSVSKGYALAFDEDGNNITSVESIKQGEVLNIQLKDGSALVEVKKVWRKNDGKGNII